MEQHPLAELRRRRRLSQEELASQTSIKRVAIAKVEANIRKLQVAELVAVSDGLNLTDTEAMTLARELASDRTPVSATTPIPARGAA